MLNLSLKQLAQNFPYIFKKAQEYKIDIVPKWYKDITNENKEIK